MATKFRLRRSATADKRPIESDLLLGELALNTYDGRLYTKRDTNNVGIADTAALLTPWTENFGGGSIYYFNSVGIGTTNPGGTLEVSGTTHYQLVLRDSNNSGNAAETALAFKGSDNADLGLVGYNSWEHGDLKLQNSTSGKNIRFLTHNGTAIGERLRISSAGNVGIGTDVPDEILHLGQLGTGSNNYNEGRLKIGGFQGTGYGFLVGYDNRGSGRGNIVNVNNSGGDNNRINIGFGAITSSGVPTTEVVTINQSGKVGIGSALPDYMLDVSGAINSETDVKVGGVSVSDTALNDAVAMAIALG